MKRLARTTLAFVAIGLAIYAGLYAAAERLVQRTAHANPIHKIEAAGDEAYDWIILGASHAMPLDFADFNAQVLEKATGLRIINLAAQGTGPLYQRFVLEEFLRGRKARNVLYVVDSFAFYSREWNEDRLQDAFLKNRVGQFPQRPLGKIASRLARIGLNLRHRQHQYSAAPLEWRLLRHMSSRFFRNQRA